jgi:small basic protein
MREEWYKFLLGILATALGLLLGLLINSLVNYNRNKKAYRAMLAAIKSEARANKAILDESFKPYFKDGVVLRELSVETVSQYLANALFVQYATPQGIEVLNVYLRNLKLANAYRARAERIQVAREGEGFLESIIENWDKNLKLCESNIEEVIKLER